MMRKMKKKKKKKWRRKRVGVVGPNVVLVARARQPFTQYTLFRFRVRLGVPRLPQLKKKKTRARATKTTTQQPRLVVITTTPIRSRSPPPFVVFFPFGFRFSRSFQLSTAMPTLHADSAHRQQHTVVSSWVFPHRPWRSFPPPPTRSLHRRGKANPPDVSPQSSETARAMRHPTVLRALQLLVVAVALQPRGTVVVLSLESPTDPKREYLSLRTRLCRRTTRARGAFYGLPEMSYRDRFEIFVVIN